MRNDLLRSLHYTCVTELVKGGAIITLLQDLYILWIGQYIQVMASDLRTTIALVKSQTVTD